MLIAMIGGNLMKYHYKRGLLSFLLVVIFVSLK